MVAGALGAFTFTQVLATVAMVGLTLYQSSAAKRKAKAEAARQRAEYNASLSDRMTTVVSAEAPQRVVYGESYIGGAIVAMFTSDRPSSGTPFFNIGEQPGARSFTADGKSVDALKHLVIVLTSHECQEIGEIKIDGVELGPLNAAGFPIQGEFVKTDTAWGMLSGWVPANGAITFPQELVSAPVMEIDPFGGREGSVPAYPINRVGNTVYYDPALAGEFYLIHYQYTWTRASVKVSKHLGVPGEAADAYLMSAVPGKWTAAHKLSGHSYLVVTLDVNEKRFQGGPPPIQVRVKGKKVYDPRTGLTAWSANPALCVADFLQSPMWQSNSNISVVTSDLIAAANACDVAIPNPNAGQAGQPATVPKYTCNGSFTTDESPPAVLEDLLESMAGYAFVAGGWRILAGAWTAPIATLDQSKADGEIEVSQVGHSWSEVFNGVRGNYIPLGQTASQDFTPYRNSALVTGDGRELWEDLSLPFTNEDFRCKNLARIRVEKSRNGLTLRWPASMEHWGLQPGDRVWVNHADFGFVNKTFKVTEWSFGVNTPVYLSLQEDVASVYDLSDQVVVDQSPNTSLPNPYSVPNLVGLTAQSGTDQLVLQADGTVITSVLLSWDRDSSVAGTGWVTIQHRRSTPENAPVQTVRVPGDETSVRLFGYVEGNFVLARARFENDVATGRWSDLTHIVVGKDQPPSAVPAASVDFDASSRSLVLRWQRVADLDVSLYEVRTADTDWGIGTPLFLGDASSCPVPPVATAWYVRARDSVGNYSTASAVASIALQPVPNVTGVEHVFADTSLTAATITLSWTDADPAFGLGSYRVVSPDGTINVLSNSVTLPANWIGNRNFTIYTVDRYGYLSPGVTYSVTKLAPAAALNFRAQVIDNTVLLYWQLPAITSLPIAHSLLKKGSSWASATTIGTKAGEFTTISELAAGSYTYWLAVVDTDGNESAPVSLTTAVSQPPDFVFNAEYTTAFAGTKSNAKIEAGSLLLPLNLTETWQTHFTSRSWDSPQAQVSAGYPVFAQPGLASGYYEETFDYGTSLASSSVKLNSTGVAVVGTCTVTPTISISLNGSTWTDYPGLDNIFALNFRYVKVRLTVTQVTAGALYKLTGLNVRLDSKLKTDAGTVSAVSSDAQGTIVNFNTEFVDVVSVAPSALGTSARNVVVDLLDTVIQGTYTVTSAVATVNASAHGLLVGQKVRLAPSSGLLPLGVYTVASVVNANSYTVAAPGVANTSGNLTTYPNSMRVYLYDTSGVRQSGPVSWTIRGS